MPGLPFRRDSRPPTEAELAGDDEYPHWRRTVAIVWVCQFMAMLGAGLVYPFLPFYLEDLGMETDAERAIWTGILGTSSGVALFFFSPLWGNLADRMGRKKMLLRSYFAGIIVMGLQGYAPNVWWLLAMRIGQGVFMGSTATATALVAANVPKARLSGALGLVSTAGFISQVAAPMIGGLLGVIVGFRLAFVITACMYALAGITAWRYLEEGTAAKAAAKRAREAGTRHPLKDPYVAVMIGILFVIYAAPALSRPVLPLLLESFDEAADSADAGFVFAAIAATSIVSSLSGARIASRVGASNTLVGALVLAGGAYLLVPFSNTLVLLMLTMGFVGLFSGTLIPVANSILGQRSPDGRQGATFGLAGSAQAAGMAVGPVAGGVLVAALSPAAGFEATGIALLLTAVAVYLFVTRMPAPGSKPSPVSAPAGAQVATAAVSASDGAEPTRR